MTEELCFAAITSHLHSEVYSVYLLVLVITLLSRDFVATKMLGCVFYTFLVTIFRDPFVNVKECFQKTDLTMF